MAGVEEEPETGRENTMMTTTTGKDVTSCSSRNLRMLETKIESQSPLHILSPLHSFLNQTHFTF